MNIIEKTIGCVGGVFGVLLALIPNLSPEEKILALLVLFSVCICCFYAVLWRRYKKLLEDLDDKNQKHTALAHQFSRKNNILRQYENAFQRWQILLMIAIQPTSRTKITELYKDFLNIQKEIENGGENYVR